MSDETKSAARGLLGNRWVATCSVVLVIAMLGFLINLWSLWRDSSADAGYLELASELRILSQELVTSARQAIGGETEAYDAHPGFNPWQSGTSRHSENFNHLSHWRNKLIATTVETNTAPMRA